MPLSIRLEAAAAASGSPRRKPASGEKLRKIRSDGERMAVAAVEDVWKINDEWWRGPDEEIERIYYTLVLENDQRVTLFHDLARDEWRRQAD